MKIATEKKTYRTPQLIRVQLDNEISLVLVSENGDPGDPNALLAPEYFNSDPFKSNIA